MMRIRRRSRWRHQALEQSHFGLHVGAHGGVEVVGFGGGGGGRGRIRRRGEAAGGFNGDVGGPGGDFGDFGWGEVGMVVGWR
jgi:hypothetical protein